MSPHSLARDDDELVRRLLDGLDLPDLPAGAIAAEYDLPLADLRTVLAADYREAPGFPSTWMTHELLRVVENLINPYRHIWKCWQDRQDVHQLRKVFRWGDVVVNAQPYLQDTGLSLWGFSCEARLDARNKFVIYLNTAHDPGAIAATIGHELGHYVYNVIGAGTCAQQAAMGNIFAQHLTQEEELFSDAVVALSAYRYHDVKRLIGPGDSQRGGTADAGFADQIRAAFSAIDAQYRIDLNRDGLSASWRVRYLTLMIHFFKLRCALADVAGI